MKRKKVLSWILLIVWMVIIFSFSHQPAVQSSSLSDGILVKIEKVTHLPISNEFSSFFIRKAAHFTEYAILGILGMCLLSQYSISKKNRFLFAIIFCFCYASLDEIHQLFIEGRSGQWIDVVLDTCGSLFGMIFLQYFADLRQRHV